MALLLVCAACDSGDGGSARAGQTVVATIPAEGPARTEATEAASTPVTQAPPPRPTDTATLPPTSTPTPRPCVSSAEAGSHIGEQVTVCGVVAGASYRPDVNGQPTFINFDRAFPNHTFTALVWGDRRANFNPPPEVHYGAGAFVCVAGVVELFEGRPQTIVESPSQISAC